MLQPHPLDQLITPIASRVRSVYVFFFPWRLDLPGDGSDILIHGWCPQRERGTLSSEEKKNFHFFYFMKRDVGSLALLDINFSHGEERVFEMHLRLGPWMIYFLLSLGHLTLGTYHLFLRISALTFGDVCWIPPFYFQ